MRRLNGPERAQIVQHIREKHYWNAERAETALISDDGGAWPQIVGKTLRQIAEELLGTTDYAEAAAQILVRTHGAAQGIFFVMNEQDMLYFLARDTGIGSDGYALSGDPARVGYRPHPRSYAAISEFFRLARVHSLCTTEEAVRRVTAKPASLLGLHDRGLLAPGMIADVTVFDPQAIAPRATYLDPIRLSQGVAHVLISGEPAMLDGVQTEARLGRFLRRGRS